MSQELKSHYNYNEVLLWVEQKGVELYGSHFRIHENDLPIINKLLAYFLHDEQTAYQNNIDLAKGILLVGPIGCGKTSILNIMKFLSPMATKFYIKPCRDISFEFFEKGYPVIQTYSRAQQNATGIICFDDLGLENNLKHFGNECNIMAEILLSRYDLFISKKTKTHITTNLSATEIETFYGNRIRSRLRSMVNLLAFPATTIDKR